MCAINQLDFEILNRSERLCAYLAKCIIDYTVNNFHHSSYFNYISSTRKELELDDIITYVSCKWINGAAPVFRVTFFYAITNSPAMLSKHPQ